MRIEEKLMQHVIDAVDALYGQKIISEAVTINYTRPDFEGDLTLVVFPFLRFSKKPPEQTAEEIGAYLTEKMDEVVSTNVIKGFLNISITNRWWLQFLKRNILEEGFYTRQAQSKNVVLEYCGPNTNKPLHLGHIRNMVLGYSMSEILKAAGNEVKKVNIYNDRGIAICKSMVAWQRMGAAETPENTGIKGDHLVGKYYVAFEKMLQEELKPLLDGEADKNKAAAKTAVMQEAQVCLKKWEEGDPGTMALWKKMNGWVYEGFEETYKSLGVDFDKAYYESSTWQKGKEMVMEGLGKGVFYQKEDQSIWVDLSDVGLDHKLLLRSDGTSVYITQDLGTAEMRYQDYGMDQSIYVVANEQDYHFQVLKETLKKLGRPYADGIYHLSYGMVDLPSGKMKSREGTVVDADDLIEEMIETAARHAKELGKIEDFSDEEAQQLYKTIGLGALKFFILRVDPKKRMMFNPEESIDFHGHTGPFVQYTYARIQSVLRKNEQEADADVSGYELMPVEKELLIELYKYPEVVEEAAATYEPSTVANYAYNLAKLYNKFYGEYSILKAESAKAKAVRLKLSMLTGKVIRSAFGLLGINVPERM